MRLSNNKISSLLEEDVKMVRNYTNRINIKEGHLILRESILDNIERYYLEDGVLFNEEGHIIRWCHVRHDRSYGYEKWLVSLNPETLLIKTECVTMEGNCISPYITETAMISTLKAMFYDLRRLFPEKWDKMLNHRFKTQPYYTGFGQSHGLYINSRGSKLGASPNEWTSADWYANSTLWVGDVYLLIMKKYKPTWFEKGHSIKECLNQWELVAKVPIFEKAVQVSSTNVDNMAWFKIPLQGIYKNKFSSTIENKVELLNTDILKECTVRGSYITRSYAVNNLHNMRKFRISSYACERGSIDYVNRHNITIHNVNYVWMDATNSYYEAFKKCASKHEIMFVVKSIYINELDAFININYDEY